MIRKSLKKITKEIYRYPSFYGMDHLDNGVPVIRGEHINDMGRISTEWSQYWFISPEISNEYPKTILEEGDLVFTVRGTIGKIGLIEKSHTGAQLSPNLIRISPAEDCVISKYLWYFFQFVRGTDDAVIQNAATIAAVRASDLAELEVPLPSIEEQKRISAILEEADQARHAYRFTESISANFLQEVFIELFGDPVSNPMSWERITLADVIISGKDGPHVSPPYVENGVPFLSTRNVRPGQIIWDDLKYISREDAKSQWKKVKPERGDILYTKGGTTGLAKAVDFDLDFAVWVHIAVLKIRRNKVLPIWLEHMLNTNYCYQQSQQLTFGIVNRDLGLKRMPKIEMYLPPFELQERFAEIVEAYSQNLVQQHESVRQAEHLFQTLLHRAFQGEL